MKKKFVIAFIVTILFGVMAVIMTASNESARPASTPQNAAVKICPHSGLPCDGDGECDDANECGKGTHASCDSHSK